MSADPLSLLRRYDCPRSQAASDAFVQRRRALGINTEPHQDKAQTIPAGWLKAWSQRKGKSDV